MSLDLVFPPNCSFCHSHLETSAAGLICDACRLELTDQRAACERCGSTAKAQDGPAATCPHCARERLYFDATVRLGSYEGSRRTAVLRIKKPSERGLAITLCDLLFASNRQRLVALGAEAVVPVPMHWSRKMWRGANSPETISERLSRHLDLPMAAQLLARCRRTAPQASLSPNKRLANVRGAFRARKHVDLPGARLLLVDDIMTTGATLNEAAKVLRRAGASFIAVAVVARAEGLA
jgi:ComF family protein